MRGVSFALKKEAAAPVAAVFLCPELCAVSIAAPFQSAPHLLHSRHETDAG
jgi:hypothetical protein